MNYIRKNYIMKKMALEEKKMGMLDFLKNNNEEEQTNTTEINNEDILYNGVSILKPKSYSEDSKKSS
ncbi:hypothetical protein QQA45_02545 [Sneathia sanguinegens]|uniref:Uncharacterized protein n=1 Tax=Sneathia sanguinegens TaxID=40543 RepID=A0ABT7HL77_9FUSO|nr:hypothetical protein [Sneathia sanguinegens]MDK9580395.1 hypothetical protein [Sneathia sanguinegens]